MNPQIIFAVRIVFFGLVAAAASAQAGTDWLNAVLAGLVAAGTYAGVGAVSKIEPEVGRKS